MQKFKVSGQAVTSEAKSMTKSVGVCFGTGIRKKKYISEELKFRCHRVTFDKPRRIIHFLLLKVKIMVDLKGQGHVKLPGVMAWNR